MTKRKRIPSAEAQAIILQAADELFYQKGIRAVSVDAVVERANINKMSVYRQFSSKDDLILAYLAKQHGEFCAEWEASLAKHPGDPRAQIMQFIVDLTAKASVHGFRGCCFMNIAVEFPDIDHPARQFVFEHEQILVRKILALTELLGVKDPSGLAHALALLIEGTYAASQTFGTSSETIQVLPSIAETLLDAAMKESQPPST